MPHTIETTAYKFAELSDSAKEKARSWWRESENETQDTSFVYEDAATCGAILGIDLRTRSVKLMGGGTRRDPCIFYSGFWSQGDGACFEGSYSYAKGAAKKIRQHAPQDTELARIADELQKLQSLYRYKLVAETKHSGHYYHSGCMRVETWNRAKHDDAPYHDKIVQLMRDFADWIYDQLRKEYEWRMADENVDESITINEYDFDEEGRII